MRKFRARSLFFLPAVEDKHPAVWQPQVDIYHARGGWVVKMDLAGVQPQDVSITVCGSQLRVGGVRYDRMVEEGCSYYAMEITYNRFERTIELPCDLERARITVEGREGMLLLRVIAREDTDNV